MAVSEFMEIKNREANLLKTFKQVKFVKLLSNMGDSIAKLWE